MNRVAARSSLHAEQIINEGKAKYYDIAVRRLALVRRAYQHAGRAEEWRR
jgi:uncharacterized Zn finger protein